MAYYHGVPLDDSPGAADGVETDEVRWFAPDEFPSDEQLAPPGTFPQILVAWRVAYDAGATVTPLLDQPGA